MRNQQKGFTLVEMMIVVAVIAILSAIAIPAYNDYIRTSRHTEGINEIAAIQLAQEEFFLENNTYFGPTAQAGANASDELYGLTGGLWVPAKWDKTKTDLQNFQNMNFWYAIDLCPGDPDVSTCYIVRATGQNDVDAGIVLTRQRGD